jgi:hypothetical protein
MCANNMFLRRMRQAIGGGDDNEDDENRGCGNVRKMEEEGDAETWEVLISI